MASSSILPLFIIILGLPHKSLLSFVDFKFNREIIKCIVNNPIIGTSPETIGTPISLIGIVARFAIIIEITTS